MTAHPWRYGMLGMPLAFLALPLYVHLPNVYAREFGVPLATLGFLLLAARAIDALADPAIGVFVDRVYRRSTRSALRTGVVAAAVLAVAFTAVWLPPLRTPGGLIAWASVSLVVAYIAYSVLSVLHQAWGAMLGGSDERQGTLVGWREGFALVGVLLAAIAPSVAGREGLALSLAVLLALGCWAWTSAQSPLPGPVSAPGAWRAPWRDAKFRRLLLVFLCNGIASAVPATLILFFVQDRLRAAPAMEPAFLAVYFLAAALAVPLWVRLVARIGLAPAWLAGMGLAIGAFCFTALLGEGDATLFLIVCAVCGVALGADLVAPSALLARVIDSAGLRGRAEGVYFGWWNCASKLNLALAAGLALPALGLAGYVPGARDAGGLQALTAAYCILPCLLKAGAALLLRFHFMPMARTP